MILIDDFYRSYGHTKLPNETNAVHFVKQWSVCLPAQRLVSLLAVLARHEYLRLCYIADVVGLAKQL